MFHQPQQHETIQGHRACSSTSPLHDSTKGIQVWAVRATFVWEHAKNGLSDKIQSFLATHNPYDFNTPDSHDQLSGECPQKTGFGKSQYYTQATQISIYFR